MPSGHNAAGISDPQAGSERAEQPAGRSATIERAKPLAEIKKPDQRMLIGNGNAAATYSPGPSPAKYHRRAEA